MKLPLRPARALGLALSAGLLLGLTPSVAMAGGQIPSNWYFTTSAQPKIMPAGMSGFGKVLSIYITNMSKFDDLGFIIRLND